MNTFLKHANFRDLRLPLSILSVSLLAACTNMQPNNTSMAKPTMPVTPFSQAALPASMKVPIGNSVFLESPHKGQIQYQCRIKAGTDNQASWFFVGPDARMLNRDGKDLGRYFGPPATWDGADGGSVLGMQLAVAPNGADNIPLQLLKTSSTRGAGILTSTSFIQRVKTVGGIAPNAPCTVASLGNTKFVPYTADYIFWKAN